MLHTLCEVLEYVRARRKWHLLPLLLALMLAGCAPTPYPTVDEIKRFRTYADAECRKIAPLGTPEHQECVRYLAHKHVAEHTQAQNDARVMGAAVAGSLQRQADAYSRAAQQPVYVPRRQTCYVNRTSPQHSQVVCY